jgi:hypothetical protein
VLSSGLPDLRIPCMPTSSAHTTLRRRFRFQPVRVRLPSAPLCVTTRRLGSLDMDHRHVSHP